MLNYEGLCRGVCLVRAVVELEYPPDARDAVAQDGIVGKTGSAYVRPRAANNPRPLLQKKN